MSKVKWDRNPDNDFSDGYDSARRYAKKHTSLDMVLYILLAGIIIGICLGIL